MESYYNAGNPQPHDHRAEAGTVRSRLQEFGPAGILRPTPGESGNGRFSAREAVQRCSGTSTKRRNERGVVQYPAKKSERDFFFLTSSEGKISY